MNKRLASSVRMRYNTYSVSRTDGVAYIVCRDWNARGNAMSSKTDTEVIIGGKIFTLSGYESEEYLQKVASYINNKLDEYGRLDSFRKQPLDTQSVLMQLNIADDYFKAKKQIGMLEEELQAKEKELYDLKHELIAAQIKLEDTQKQTKELQNKLNEDAQKIVRLETELKHG